MAGAGGRPIAGFLDLGFVLFTAGPSSTKHREANPSPFDRAGCLRTDEPVALPQLPRKMWAKLVRPSVRPSRGSAFERVRELMSCAEAGGKRNAFPGFRKAAVTCK